MIPKQVFEGIEDLFNGAVRLFAVLLFIILGLVGLVIYLLVR